MTAMTPTGAAPPPLFPLAGRRIWVAGHTGMVGSAIARRLDAAGAAVLTVPRAQLDLTRQAAVEEWMADQRPDGVVIAAAKVGGIHANSHYPVDFLHDNLTIASNIIHGAYLAGVAKLLFLGSSCTYPRLAPQPIPESALLTGPLEPTNEWYAIAKIAGTKLCQAYRRQHGCDFVAVMPTNLYGPGDNFHPDDGHVVASLMRRFHEAREAGAESVTVWGTGTPRREFLFVDDMADACVFVLERYSDESILNIGGGEEVSIAQFAATIGDVVGYRGTIAFDTTRPDGMPRKLLDGSRLAALGWQARTPLREGLERTYTDFLAGGGRHRVPSPPR